MSTRTQGPRRTRIEENFDLFDFELGEGDMAEISALDRGERTGPDPDRFNGRAPPATPRRRD
ncbi:hypothetical protein [Streptomyces sp. NPDC058623]|uniref:hypothetical protein n=1 Tax=Streptomyces sp. NPDC058623 TaxID=3346563 RepID=UPI003647B27E